MPARISAALLLAGGALRRLPARRGWRIAWRDHRRTESPNAGWTIGACAGLLGVALEKLGHYRIGHGLPDPTWHDLAEAERLAYAAAALAMAATVVVSALRALPWG